MVIEKVLSLFRLDRFLASAVSESNPIEDHNGFLSCIPVSVFVVAIFAALVHLMPYWHAQTQTPLGWTFTGNVASNPDYMQYRVWTRQTEQTGVLVTNKFTTEPNNPYLPVLFYYVVGQLSRWIGISPEYVYAYMGSLFAFILTVLLFAIVRCFLKPHYQVWWIFLTILVGGGLGAHLKLLSMFDWVKDNFILKHTIVDGLLSVSTFEDYRSHYVFITLFDTHFLLIWLSATMSVISLYFALQKFSCWRVLTTALLSGVTALLHLYEGVTLVVVMLAVVLLLWRKALLSRATLTTVTVSLLAVVVSMLWQVLLSMSSGLPLPTWRGDSILLSILLLSYPLAWILIFWGITDYWRKAGFNEIFLLGWALGCTALTLSGPFYPYPARGTMTLQIPLYIIAGGIYFSRYTRVTPIAASLAVLVLAATPIWTLAFQWKATDFSPNEPSLFISAAHQEIVDALGRRASENDVLIVNKSDVPWKTDDLWLAPEFPGKLYCGHFFLTPDYDRKCAEINHFFNDPTDRGDIFLREKGIRFVYVNAKDEPSRFENVPGLTLLKAESIGSLFVYSP